MVVVVCFFFPDPPNIVKFHVTAEPLPSTPRTVSQPMATMAAKQPPPLMKKHSQTDLVSRLKTRKILGVGGEDDDGEVHRSKVRAGEIEEGRDDRKETFCPGKPRWWWWSFLASNFYSLFGKNRAPSSMGLL